MTTTSWRIVKRKRARTAFDGEGARVYGGRWNSPGLPAVYTSGTAALALLETLVHATYPILHHFCVIPVTFAATLVEVVKPSALPLHWEASPAPRSVIAIGDRWLRSGTSAVLRVPSAVVPTEWNYILNPKHTDFSKLVIGAAVPFPIDPRLAS